MSHRGLYPAAQSGGSGMLYLSQAWQNRDCADIADVVVDSACRSGGKGNCRSSCYVTKFDESRDTWRATCSIQSPTDATVRVGVRWEFLLNALQLAGNDLDVHKSG